MELIDSHCHLHYDYSPKSEADLVKEAQEVGVSTLITVGTDMATMDEMARISERHERVFHTVGLHPHDAITLQDGDIDRLRKAAAHPKCRAIGEIGLDYHYEHSPRETQISVINQQLDLAAELKLPVVIHSREAEADLLVSLKRYCAKLSGSHVPGVIHCFTGTRPFGEACLELGFYISFSGILTFKNSEDLRDSARAFRLERLLVETDSPYLAPMPMRGKKCEPSMVKYTAMKLAEVKGVTFEEVARITTENTKRVFGI